MAGVVKHATISKCRNHLLLWKAGNQERKVCRIAACISASSFPERLFSRLNALSAIRDALPGHALYGQRLAGNMSFFNPELKKQGVAGVQNIIPPSCFFLLFLLSCFPDKEFFFSYSPCQLLDAKRAVQSGKQGLWKRRAAFGLPLSLSFPAFLLSR
jgi:hypothetical protein